MKKVGASILKSGIISWILLIAIWQIASLFNSPDFLPSPLKTLEGLKDVFDSGVLMEDIGISLQRVAIGWGRGILIAIPIGLLIGAFKPVRALIEQYEIKKFTKLVFGGSSRTEAALFL